MPAKPLTRNRWFRALGFVAGIALFYAPFALLVKTVGMALPATPLATTVSDVHSACLRMPLGWAVQPWMWPQFGGNPIYFLPAIVLPIAAVAVSPLFCGWLCPAGAFPELLGRPVPDRFKFDLKKVVSVVPLRYGFFVGFLLAPFVSSNICCAFCNFTHMQNIVSATFGDPSGLLYFTSLGVVAAGLWIVPLGMFAKGGRGWCMLLCPAGTLMGLSSALTARFGWTRRVRVDAQACTSCGSCADTCPMRAVEVEPETPAKVEQHLCIGCMDCTAGCPSSAITYGTRK